MAFKITAADMKRIASLKEKLREAEGDISDRLNDFNQALLAARSEVDEALVTINETRDELRGVIEDIHSEQSDNFDEKSEKWQDGDKGEETRSWIEKLDEIKTDLEEEIEIEWPDEMTFALDDLNDVLDEIEAQPS